jgi:hypothetical protein
MVAFNAIALMATNYASVFLSMFERALRSQAGHCYLAENHRAEGEWQLRGQTETS